MSDAEPVVRLTRAQVREIDRRATEEYHIPGIVLMENAARGVADVAMRYIQQAQRRDTLVLCGGGNNGGDGLAVARHLHNRGVNVKLGLTVEAQKYSGDALTNWRICEAMRLPTVPTTAEAIADSACGVVIDAIFGTGLHEPPRGAFEQTLTGLLVLAAEVIAVDLPSGLDCDTGQRLGRGCVRVRDTVTFVAEKAGFVNPESRQYTGEITVADIGCPRELIDVVRREVQ